MSSCRHLAIVLLTNKINTEAAVLLSFLWCSSSDVCIMYHVVDKMIIVLWGISSQVESIPSGD